MKIEFIKTISGPVTANNFDAGAIVEMDPQRAKEFIASGAAKPIAGSPVEKAVSNEPAKAETRDEPKAKAKRAKK